MLQTQDTNNALLRLSAKQLDSIITVIGDAPEEHSCRKRLKQHWPSLTVIFCSEDDLAEREPFWRGQHYELHLMAASLGCAQFTLQPECATGIIIALREAEL